LQRIYSGEMQGLRNLIKLIVPKGMNTLSPTLIYNQKKLGGLVVSVEDVEEKKPKCHTFGCANHGIGYTMIGPGTVLWLCARCSEEIREDDDDADDWDSDSSSE